MNDTLYEIPKDCDFNTVGNNSTIPNDCSPRLLKKFFSPFQGILINAAPEIVWPKGEAVEDMEVMPNGQSVGALQFNVAGLAKLPYNILGLKGDFAYRIVVVAVNQTTAESYSGNMIFFGTPTPRPNVPGLVEAQENQDATKHFNIDLVQNLGLPIKDATYSVYAVLESFKSNVVTVKTVIQ